MFTVYDCFSLQNTHTHMLCIHRLLHYYTKYITRGGLTHIVLKCKIVRTTWNTLYTYSGFERSLRNRFIKIVFHIFLTNAMLLSTNIHVTTYNKNNDENNNTVYNNAYCTRYKFNCAAYQQRYYNLLNTVYTHTYIYIHTIWCVRRKLVIGFTNVSQ